jgi:hypothetical protein
MITLYARKEPTKDKVLLKFHPNAREFDTVVYNEPDCKTIKARIRWDKKQPDNGFITLNCFPYKLEWVQG